MSGKTKPSKTEEKRISEVNHLKSQIDSLQIPSSLPGIIELNKRLDDYSKNGMSWSGKIKVPEMKFCMHVILTTHPSKDINVRLTKMD